MSPPLYSAKRYVVVWPKEFYYSNIKTVVKSELVVLADIIIRLSTPISNCITTINIELSERHKLN